jgi:hypothetical protein
MSSANVELARVIFAPWERRDFNSAEWAHPDIEFVRVGGAERGSLTGLAAMAEVWRDFLSAWEERRVEAEEYRECDGVRLRVSPRSPIRRR